MKEDVSSPELDCALMITPNGSNPTQHGVAHAKYCTRRLKLEGSRCPTQLRCFLKVKGFCLCNTEVGIASTGSNLAFNTRCFFINNHKSHFSVIAQWKNTLSFTK